MEQRPNRQHKESVEQIAAHYNSALDSVSLITALLSKEVSTDEDLAVIARNVAHLEIMVAKTYWTTEDLTPLENAITDGKQEINPPV